jgi:membrane protease YdiL (CAAX protease family)
MLLVLLGYVGAIGAMAYKYRDVDSGPVLPSSTAMLLKVAGGEIGMFAVLFAVVAWLARPSFKELFMTRWDGFITLGLSVVWSVAVRILAIPAVTLYGAVLYLWRHLNHGAAVTGSELRPQFEQLLPPEALQDPWYVIVAATVLSFGLGGFREELWRAGVMACFNSVLPERWKNTRNGWAAGILLASVVFGSAHITQGLVGVVMTGMVGLGLGTIMVWRRSYWEAALAHGIFDATSIVTLWAVQRYFPEELKQMMVQ